MLTTSARTIFADYLEAKLKIAIEAELADYVWYRPALNAISETTITLDNRSAAVREFLRKFAVFQGFTRDTRRKFTDCIVEWSDKRSEPTLAANQVGEAQFELATLLQKIHGSDRRFTSMASKALWLKYPEMTPIYDRNAFVALTVLSRLESVEPPNGHLRTGDEDYSLFLLYWRHFYG